MLWFREERWKTDMSIRVFLADDHAVVRTGLSAVLSMTSEFVVVGDAADGAETLEKVRPLCTAQAVDVLLLDLLMPRLNGIEVTKLLRESGCLVPIVILTSSVEDAHVVGALQVGATSYLLKTSSPKEILATLRAAYCGEGTLSKEVQQSLIGQLQRPGERDAALDLTVREREVLRALALGKSNQEIADHLGIGLKTVKSHVSSIFLKLSVQDRTQAAIYAIRHGLDR
jgi:NarL family two-component system response regulator LiaR